MASFTLWQAVGTLYQLAFRALGDGQPARAGAARSARREGPGRRAGQGWRDGRGWRPRASMSSAKHRRLLVWRDVSPLDGWGLRAVKDDPGTALAWLVAARAPRQAGAESPAIAASRVTGPPAPRLLTLKALPGYMAQPIFDDGRSGRAVHGAGLV
jgi:hypothetical protein